MEERKLLAIILLSAHLTTLECDLKFLSRKYNIRKFLNTHHPIWTYMTRQGGNTLCTVDVITSMSPDSMFYHHLYYEKGVKRNVTFMGIFDKQNKNRISVSRKGGPYNMTEEIVFYNKAHHCAVIMISMRITGGLRMYDLRVWNSTTVVGNARPCLRKFTELEPKRHCIYENFCKGLFHTSSRSPQLIQQSAQSPRQRL
nr:uncharacterized protein LOC126534055 [Dermacentor andersoni]